MPFDTLGGLWAGILAMDKAKEFRELAAQCVLMSCDAVSEQQGLAHLEMAQRWRHLADQVERAEIAIKAPTPGADVSFSHFPGRSDPPADHAARQKG